jgi:hypothetical protein
MEANLFMICISSFVSVFTVLAFLAIAMRLLIALFPDKKDETDPAIVAAIGSTYAVLYPGARITKIEEVRGGKR